MVLQQQHNQSPATQQQVASRHLLSAFQSAAGQQRTLSPLTCSLASHRTLVGHHQQQPFKPSILTSSSNSPTSQHNQQQQANSRLITNLSQQQQVRHQQQQHKETPGCNSCSSSQASISSAHSDRSSLSPINSQHSSSALSSSSSSSSSSASASSSTATSSSGQLEGKQRREAAAAAAATNIGIMQQQQQVNMQQQAQNSSRYKTELCRPFEENGTCKYGEKCQFAHGLAELRTLARHPKYKTEFCRTFHTTGFCPYGPRCHFIHNGRGPAPAHITQHASPPQSASQPEQQQPAASTLKPKQQSQHETTTVRSSPSSSPLSSACSSASSSASTSSSSCSSSGKGSSVYSPPSCSESPPALSSSPDSSMLGSSSVSCSPNHQLHEISLLASPQHQEQHMRRSNPFACSLSAQLGHLTNNNNNTVDHQQQHPHEHKVVAGEHGIRRNAPGLSLPSQEQQSLLFNKPVGFDRFSSSSSTSSSDATTAPAPTANNQYNSSHAFLWLQSQLNGGGNKQQVGVEGQDDSLSLSSPSGSLGGVNSTFGASLSLLGSMSVSEGRGTSSETWTSDNRNQSGGEESCLPNEQAGEPRWPACSGLAMSQASVAATRRTWQMQA